MLFEDIYENYFKDVCRLCFSLTKNEENAEDLAQETFVKALASIDSFDGSKDIRAWLFTIAKNTFYSECRKKWLEYMKLWLRLSNSTMPLTRM